jgi:prepilin-type N-terminal cleavage/methylation domain-containing protein
MKLLQIRSAFTLLELIVTITVIGVILAVVVNLVQATMRETARKTACRNKIRELAIALNTYEENKKGFPSLYFTNATNLDFSGKDTVDPTLVGPHYTWIVKVLPYLPNQKAIYDKIDAASKEFSLPLNEVMLTDERNQKYSPGQLLIEPLQCAANRQDVDASFNPGTTNYVAVTTTKQQLLTVGKNSPTLADGTIIPSGPSQNFKGIGNSKIRDGVSKTMLLSESKEAVKSNWYHWQQTFVCSFPPSETSNEWPNIDSQKRVWDDNNPNGSNRSSLNFGPTKLEPYRSYSKDFTDPLYRTWGGSSDHSGNIVIHVNVDASIREVQVEGLNRALYYAATTSHGSEPMDIDCGD